MTLLDRAKKLLRETDSTCIALIGEESYLSKERGISPILNQLEKNEQFFKGAIVADKVVGKSAAMLYKKAQIHSLYASIISEHALRALKDTGIIVTYEKVVPYIINRQGDGMCPMEASVLEIEEVNEAYEVLRNKMAMMRKNQ